MISVTDINKSIDYLMQLGNSYFENKYYTWNVIVTWEDLCDWIALGPVSSLGSRLTEDNKYYLSNKMKSYLKNASIEKNSVIHLSWGFKVIILRRN